MQHTTLACGDMIFIRVDSALYRRVAAGSGSWTNHVGLILKPGPTAASTIVIESRIPTVQCTTLAAFLRRSDQRQTAIRRWPGGLTSIQTARLTRFAHSQLGRPYHLRFDYHARWTFCSKFVYQCYHYALGEAPGALATFRELLAQQPDHSLTFWQWWFGGRIPWDQVTVTPASQLLDPRLVRIPVPSVAKANNRLHAA